MMRQIERAIFRERIGAVHIAATIKWSQNKREHQYQTHQKEDPESLILCLICTTAAPVEHDRL
jgi:hypothetical protein